jgi:ribosomal RNA-processing protein 1
MHDSKNALSVQRLIADLAGTMRTMEQKDQQLAHAANAQSPSWLDTWSTAFWETICREWASIDQWRMNKILLLVRFVIREHFGLALGWAVKEDPNLKDQVANQLQVFETWPLSPRERKVPDGLRLHVLDVWVEELARQLSAAQKALDDAENSDPESKKNVLLNLAQEFMEPVRKVGREGLSRGVKIRAKEAVKLAEEQLSG